MVGATDTCGSAPESVGEAAFDDVGGVADDVGSSAGEADEAATTGDDAEPPACAIAHPGGVANHPLTSGGRAREYRLFVPDSHDGETRLPLLLNPHGTGGNAAGQAADSGMEQLAREDAFIVIGLQGLDNSWNVLMNDPNAVDDVQYAGDVLDDALQKVCFTAWPTLRTPTPAWRAKTGSKASRTPSRVGRTTTAATKPVAKPPK
jgi:hypothetical protein